MMNTRIHYLYRDADNYKVQNECVILGEMSGGAGAAHHRLLGRKGVFRAVPCRDAGAKIQ